MTISITIDLPLDPDRCSSVDVVNRIKELIETDSLYFRWETVEEQFGNSLIDDF